MFSLNLSTYDYGIIIHIIFLFSIFDIYFKSPVVNDVLPYQPIHDPPSNRLILFVVDGLRAESFLNYTTMPYLRSIANSHGRWGISHTRVPTESRPGHVAIIAGFYEDPSAVTQGWKENPVDFDSVFNRTKFTWSWGAYDIVNIFTKGTVDGHIYVSDFDPYDETFSADKSTILLDEWVFRNVRIFFEKAESNAELKKNLFSDKIVLFLHLLGTDTSGHTHKPKTQNFLATVENVDENIKVVEKVIRKFYNDDGKTTFLMTSDHGMTDWGSHGTGDHHETKTPYVLWGAGVQQMKRLNVDAETKDMSMEHRHDIEQADLAPLMSTLLSIPVPVNSIGKLPVDLLNMTLPNKAKAVYSNSKQLMSQYNKKKQDVEEHVITMLYKPYMPLNSEKILEITSFSEKLLNEHQYEDLILFSEEVINLSLSGLNYYHNYYQKPLLFATTMSFLGWITCLLNILLGENVHALTEIFKLKCVDSKFYKLKYLIKFVSALLCIVTIFLIYVQNLPFQYYFYFLMPIVLWENVLKYYDLWIYTFTLVRMYKGVFYAIFEICCYGLGCLAMGLSLTHRWLLSIPLIGMSLWPYFSSSSKELSKPVHVFWIVGCMLLSMFSFMPVVGKEVLIELVVFAGCVWMLAILTFTFSWKDSRTNRRDIIITMTQSAILAISLYIIYTQAKLFEDKLPLSGFLQTLCWIISVTVMVLPLCYTRRMSSRLLGTNTSVVNFYLLLSVSHEALFIVVLMFNITCWMYIEFKFLKLSHVKITDYTFSKDSEEIEIIFLSPIHRTLSSNDFRRAFFFTLYIILAFFGTGNIASLNSFEVRWVICFTTSFQPHIITALVLLKTLMPFLGVGCTFKAIQHITKAPSNYMITMVLIYSNIMGTQLLYYVKNTGSWLEIGTSISQYVIVQIIIVFIVVINIFSKIWTEEDIYSFALKIFKSRKKNA